MAICESFGNKFPCTRPFLLLILRRVRWKISNKAVDMTGVLGMKVSLAIKVVDVGKQLWPGQVRQTGDVQVPFPCFLDQFLFKAKRQCTSKPGKLLTCLLDNGVGGL